jgi:GNAT superfamily N-acetyltransferase
MSDNDVRIEFGDEQLLPAFCAGFNTGFTDYKYGVRMDEPQMIKFLARSGIDLEHSAVLLHRNGADWHGAGVALVAVVDGEAWCSGLAVTPALRARGLGRQLMAAIQAKAAAVGAHTLQLEVLVHNAPARRLYESLGYQPVRDLIFWRAEAPAAEAPATADDFHAANVDEALHFAYDWLREAPAWQRTQRAVALYRDELWAYKLLDHQGAAGWVICLPQAPHEAGRPRLRIMTLAVRPGDDEANLALRLVASLRAHRHDTVFSIINEPEESIFTPALQASGFGEVDRQIEMVLHLPTCGDRV